MSKPKVPTWVYKNNKLIGQFDSIAEAAAKTHDSQPAVAMIIQGKSKMSKRGYVYSRAPLSEEEIQRLPIKEQRFNSECKVHVSNRIEYEVPCSDHKVCYIPRTKEGKIMMLKKFIYNQMDYKWKTQPIQITELQKKFLQELFDAILIG